MTRVVTYSRVSTEEQAREGVSLAAQRARTDAYCTAMDLHPVQHCEDAGVSAKSLDRDGLHLALHLLDTGAAEGLVVFKLDRLTRSVRDLGVLLDEYFGKRFALFSVSDSIDTRSAAGRMVLNILTSVSQWEREAISERTRTAMAHMKQQGRRVGTVPFGFVCVDGALVPDPVEQETIRVMRSYRAEDRTLREIAELLEAEGRRSKSGAVWAPETIRKVLQRANAGVM